MSDPATPSFSHVDAEHRPTMVDVTHKQVTARSAVAESRVRLPASVAGTLRAAGYATAKGPVFHTAIVAGTMAAKRTHELIPFCHPLGLERCRIDIRAEGDEIVIRCEVGVHHRTGVEMEALTGAAVAALTIYDMCKALSHDIVLADTRLVAKDGGKSAYRQGAAAGAAPLAALILAGGKSARMQTDKAVLDYGGQTQLARVHGLLAPLVPDIYLSVRPDQIGDPARAGYRQIVDELTETGPAAGILAALASAPERAWLVVAVDLPLLDAQTLRTLIARRDPGAVATAYASAHDGMPEPLCAIWEPRARAALAASVAQGKVCPRKFLINAGARLLELDTRTALDNVNTPQEYASARARLAGAP